jgi:uridine kinase
MGAVNNLMKKILTHPFFLIGLIIRVMMVVLILPKATSEWFVPFMTITTSQFTIDPWKYFLERSGLLDAFPYGYVMWLFFLPLTVAVKALGIPVSIGYGLTLIGTDLGLLAVLYKLLPDRIPLLLGAYWLSPIVLLATYWLGFNDLVPVLLLALALFFLKNLQFFLAGFFSIAAISAKLSMVMAVPFFFIYLIRNRGMRRFLPGYLKGVMIASLLFVAPFLFSLSGLHMLFSNPEMDKIYHLAIPLGTHSQIYLLPTLYIVMLYLAWRMRRFNFALFNSMLGITFLLVVLLTPASPGWFIWMMPFLIMYQAMSGGVASVLVGLFSLFYVISSLLVMPLPELTVNSSIQLPMIPINHEFQTHIISLLHTMMMATGIILMIRIWREAISSNDYFRISRKPFVIGVAGDLASGKTTLSNSLKGLFGSHSVTSLSGNNYHLWDQHKPMWQVMTRLNPKANNLEAFVNHVIALVDGKAIHSHHYDPETGKLGKRFLQKSNDFIIVSGLHALFLPSLRACYDLSIYLATDEKLRFHFFKGKSRQNENSDSPVSTTSETQRSDSIRFIKTQAQHADLILILEPIHPDMLNNTARKEPLRIKLSVRSRSGMNELSLTRILVGVCGLHVDSISDNDTNETLMSIEGDVSAEDIAMAARMLVPRLIEFLDSTPQWADGVLGLMQLIVLTHINQALNKRLLW